eukprot:360102-Chlamydomonas_euryale.AAC.9
MGQWRGVGCGAARIKCGAAAECKRGLRLFGMLSLPHHPVEHKTSCAPRTSYVQITYCSTGVAKPHMMPKDKARHKLQSVGRPDAAQKSLCNSLLPITYTGTYQHTSTSLHTHHWIPPPFSSSLALKPAEHPPTLVHTPHPSPNSPLLFFLGLPPTCQAPSHTCPHS